MCRDQILADRKEPENDVIGQFSTLPIVCKWFIISATKVILLAI